MEAITILLQRDYRVAVWVAKAAIVAVSVMQDRR
jgi:hypothetical protein